MEKTIVIEKKEADLINRLLEMKGDAIYDKYGFKRDETITHTAKFQGGYEVDVKLVICDHEETPYCEAVLFQDGCEVAFTDPEGEYFGDWELKDEDGNVFTVKIAAA